MIFVLANLRADLGTWSDLDYTEVGVSFLDGINERVNEFLLLLKDVLSCVAKRTKSKDNVQELFWLFYRNKNYDNSSLCKCYRIKMAATSTALG